MSSNTNFFESPQAAAVYKHRLLGNYVPAWAGKVGSTSQNGRVLVYDAYSGPGRYANQEPGSPLLLVKTAEALAAKRTIRTVFSDKERSYCDQLRSLLEEHDINPNTYEVRQGPVEQHLDDVLAVAGDVPVFVFLDPFGLSVPMDRLIHLLTVRNKPGWSRLLQPKTELLMNFSYEAVRRIAGVLRSDSRHKGRDAQISTLNAALGGDWWHDLAHREPEGWVDEVLNGFATRVAEAAGYAYITADVADSIAAKPVYELILWTPHRDGLWEMAGAMSYARRDWRKFLKEKAEQESGGQMELSGLHFDDDAAAWGEEIGSNVERVLEKHSGFILEDKLDVVLGRTLGLAREMHIRQGLHALYKRDIISTEPKGDLQRFYIARK